MQVKPQQHQPVSREHTEYQVEQVLSLHMKPGPPGGPVQPPPMGGGSSSSSPSMVNMAANLQNLSTPAGGPIILAPAPQGSHYQPFPMGSSQLMTQEPRVGLQFRSPFKGQVLSINCNAK